MLVLARHGRTAANARGLLLGRADPPLDEVGRAQAAALAAAVPHAARVITSPLRRARETASAFPPQLAVTVDERWIELDYGAWDERPIAEMPAGEWAAWRADLAFRPPGGESLLELGVRVREACAELTETAADDDVVVVSHVSPIKAAVAWALGVGDGVSWRLNLSAGALTHIRLGPTGPVVASFNETAHLR